jgi:hypothetical protein
MELFSNNIVFNDIVNQIKSWIVNNNYNNSMIEEMNVNGSNISTLIDIVAYVTMVSDFKNEIYFNEYSLLDAKLETNQIKRAMEYGVIPQSKTASRIKVSINSKTTDITTTLDGGVIVLTSDKPQIQFVGEINDAITFSPNIPIEIEFKQLTPQSDLRFNVNTDVKSLDSVVTLPFRNEIEYSTFDITNVADDTFVKFDNTIDLSNLDDTKIYYMLDFSGNFAKIRFLSGFIGKTFEGEIVVKYSTTSGIDGNGLLDKNLKIKSSTLIVDGGSAIDTSQLKIIVNNEVSTNGTNESDVNLLKYLAISSFKSQHAIIRRDDLYYYLKNKYNGYDVIIITPEEQYVNISAGVIYVAMYRVVNNVVEHFSYDTEDFTELYNKLSLGVKIIWFDVDDITLNLNANVLINKNVNQNIMSNVIKSNIVNQFSNKKYFSKYEIQEKIISSGLTGLLSFSINEFDFFIQRNISNYKSNNFYYYLNSYNKLPISVYERLLDSYLKDYTITDNSGFDKKNELYNRLRFNFNNLTPDIIIYKLNDNFITTPISLNIENFMSDVPIKPLSKKLKNIEITLNFNVTSTENIVSIKNSDGRGNVTYENSTLSVTLQNPFVRKTSFNSDVAYLIDENIQLEVKTNVNSEIKTSYISLLELLDNNIQKKIFGFYNYYDSTNKIKNSIIVNDNLKIRTDEANLVFTMSHFKLKVISDIVFSNADVILLNRDNINLTFNKI